MSALDSAKYPSATHSNAPQAAHAAAASCAAQSLIPRASVSKLRARSAPLIASIPPGNPIAASPVRPFAFTLRLIPNFPHSLVGSMLFAAAWHLPRPSSSLCVLRASAFQIFPFSIPKPPNHSCVQASQALCKRSPQPAAPQHSAATGHSRCRHTQSTSPDRASVRLQSCELPPLSLLQTSPRPRSSPSTSCRLPRAASHKREARNRFLVQRVPLPELAQLPAPAAPAFRSTTRSCAPASRAMPLSRSLPQKKPGQAIVDCAAKEPTPVPGPGGRSCAGETVPLPHLPSHALQEFAHRANKSCFPAKFL